MTINEIQRPQTGWRGDVWRPVQYLGSKLRSLGAITRVVESACDSTGTVWDPFTGSSVVAQAIAQTGRRVVAHDTQHAAATFAGALLGVGRTDEAITPQSVAEELWHALVEVENTTERDMSFWEPWLSAEDDAIETGDAERLVELSGALPQRWKTKGLEQPRQPSGLDFASTYAGTYFGLRQALRIDSLRTALDDLEKGHSVSKWERDVVITALCHAASEAVFSAGKHFAQPLRPTNGNVTFAHKRLLQDRSLDIGDLARGAILQVANAARPGHESHYAEKGDALAVTRSYLMDAGVQCVYADPPYTAQQYSRFYHVLDTLVKGSSGPLQVWRGGVTRGLYPRDRYMSPFCSVVDAPEAFQRFIATVAGCGAALVLSYSASKGRSGNARMVDLKDLRAWLGGAYGKARVEVLQLDHSYRQFNSSHLATADRNEPEYLLKAVPSD